MASTRIETMKERWQDPAFRAKTLKGQKTWRNEYMQRRLLELAKGAED